MTWADAGPVVTVIVRCDLVVCGPDVAPAARAWKASSMGRPCGHRSPWLASRRASLTWPPSSAAPGRWTPPARPGGSPSRSCSRRCGMTGTSPSSRFRRCTGWLSQATSSSPSWAAPPLACTARTSSAGAMEPASRPFRQGRRLRQRPDPKLEDLWPIAAMVGLVVIALAMPPRWRHRECGVRPAPPATVVSSPGRRAAGGRP